MPKFTVQCTITLEMLADTKMEALGKAASRLNSLEPVDARGFEVWSNPPVETIGKVGCLNSANSSRNNNF